MPRDDNTIIVVGVHTGVGKTVSAGYLCTTLRAHYWKIIQAGLPDDSAFIQEQWRGCVNVFPPAYSLSQPVSVHAAARQQACQVALSSIYAAYVRIRARIAHEPLVVELPGGLLSPVNEQGQTNLDIVRTVRGKICVVSGEYLGSLNHTLLVRYVLRAEQLPPAAWFLHGYPSQYARDLGRWLQPDTVVTFDRGQPQPTSEQAQVIQTCFS